MGDREDLAALRRLAELEAKAGGATPKVERNYKALARHEIIDPTESMSGPERFLAGVGKTFTDIGQGVQQRFGFATTEDVEAKREADVPLMATPGGFGGSLAGGIAATAPVAPLAAASIPGAVGVGAAYGGMQPTGKGESAMQNAALGGATAGAMKYGIDKAVPMLSGALEKGREALAPINARAQELARVLREGRAAGLKVSPTQANPSTVNRLLESIGGKHATQQQLSASNQSAVYAAAQKHAGLPPNQALTKEALSQARSAAAEPYRQVAKISPEAEVMLKEWRKMNTEASQWWDHFRVSKHPDSFDKYEAAKRGAAAALDDIEQMAAAKPETAGLVEALKNARVRIAKIHTVEKSLKGSSVDPRSFSRAAQRGEPISGELGQMARFAQDFPQAMQAPQVGGGVGVNQLMPWLGGGTGGALGGIVGGPPGAGVGALLGAGATQTMPPLARSLLLSRPYQAAMTTPQKGAPSAALRFSEALLKYPYTQGMLPAAGGMYAGSQ